MRCPNCGSEHMHLTSKTSGGGFSFIDSCCGVILLGPLGILCGSIGSGVRTDTYWVCDQCGNMVSAEKMQRDIQKKKAAEEASQQAYTKALRELTAKDITPAQYDQVLLEAEQADRHVEYAKQERTRILKEAENNPDLVISALAGQINNEKDPLVIIGAILIVLGSVLLFVYPPVGIAIAAIGIVLGVICEKKTNKLKKQLEDLLPEYKAAVDELKTAEEANKEAQASASSVRTVKVYERKNTPR